MKIDSVCVGFGRGNVNMFTIFCDIYLGTYIFYDYTHFFFYKT